MRHILEQSKRMTLQPSEVLERGLRLLDVDNDGTLALEWRRLKFSKHYGSHPLVIAAQWFDLCHATDDNGEQLLSTNEKKRGFKMFMVAHYFLFNYTRNSEQLADRFRMCESYARGEHLWVWIRKIAFLEKKVIFWPRILDSPTSEVNALSVDGVDKKTFERKHKTQLLPFDRGNCSHKHAHGALKYQIVMAAHRPRCVHIYGPVRGGMGDKEMLERSGVLARLRPGKLIVADRGYIKKEFGGKISWPNPQEDSKEANNLKSRIRLRHESFNGKMAAFGCLNQTWRHSDDKHGIAFRAVAVTVQYALDNGTSLLFEP